MTHITIEREKLEQVLEVLEENHHLIEEHERSEYLALYDRQITAIKQALAAHPPQRTEQEPTPEIKYKMIVIDDLHPQGIPVEQWVNPPQRTEQNFCSRCGKRTPPKEN